MKCFFDSNSCSGTVHVMRTQILELTQEGYSLLPPEPVSADESK